jgi:hypothetical protein
MNIHTICRCHWHEHARRIYLYDDDLAKQAQTAVRGAKATAIKISHVATNKKKG